jgi:hypothetical protein
MYCAGKFVEDCYLLNADLLIGLFFDLEDGSNIFL